MTRKETRVQKIVHLTAKRFPSFGGGRVIEGHPIHLRDEPPQFAACVDIEKVVRFILAKRSTIDRAQRLKNYCGDDVRDYINTSDFLKHLSNKSLEEIAYLKRREIRKRLKGGFETMKGIVGPGEPIYPFWGISKKNADILAHLPSSWIYGSANWLLHTRKHKQMRTH